MQYCSLFIFIPCFPSDVDVLYINFFLRIILDNNYLLELFFAIHYIKVIKEISNLFTHTFSFSSFCKFLLNSCSYFFSEKSFFVTLKLFFYRGVCNKFFNFNFYFAFTPSNSSVQKAHVTKPTILGQKFGTISLFSFFFYKSFNFLWKNNPSKAS